MERAYAQALWNIVAGGGDHKKSVASLVEALKRTGRMQLVGKILLAFERIATREGARNDVRISVGRKSDVDAALKAAQVTEADVVIDPSLIGGYRIEKVDTLIDASWKKHLTELYRRVTA